jgi:hypothetical protein
MTILIISQILVYYILIEYLVLSRSLKLLMHSSYLIYMVPSALLINGFTVDDRFVNWRTELMDHQNVFMIISVTVFVSVCSIFCGSKIINYNVSKISQNASLQNSKKTMLCANTFVIIAFFSLFFYTQELGGWNTLMSTILLYRGGNEVVYTELSFLKQLMLIGSATWFIYADLYNTRKKKSYIFSMLFSFLIGFITVYVQGGRLSLLLYLLPGLFFIPKWVRFTGLPILAIIFISLLDPNRSLFSFDEKIYPEFNYSLFNSVLSDFFPPLVNTYWIWNMDEGKMRLFSDLLMLPTIVLPKRILGIDAYLGENAFISEIVNHPNAADLISFGLMNFGVIGIFVWSSIYGVIIKIVSMVLDQLYDSQQYFSYLAVLVFFLVRPMYFSPYHFLLSILPFLPYLFYFFYLNYSIKFTEHE